MKKQILSLFLTGATMVSMTACGSKSSVNIFKEMDAANQPDAIVSTFGKVAFSHIFYNEDGTVDKDYTYQDEKQYYLTNDYYEMVDDAGDVYGFDNGSNSAFRYLFVGDAYDTFKEERYALVGFFYEGDDMEKVISQETKDGIIFLNTEIADEEKVKAQVADNEYDPSNAKRMLFSYEVDEKTYTLRKLSTTIEYTDGTQKLRSEFERMENPEAYAPDEHLKQAVFGDDLRTVTVTVDNGTDKEKVYTQTITKGNSILPLVPPEYGELYLDADYTTALEAGGDLNDDLNLYCKSEG